VKVPYLQNTFCCFAAPSGLFLKPKNYAKQQNNQNQASRCAEPKNPTQNTLQQVQPKRRPRDQTLWRLAPQPRLRVWRKGNHYLHAPAPHHPYHRIKRTQEPPATMSAALLIKISLRTGYFTAEVAEETRRIAEVFEFAYTAQTIKPLRTSNFYRRDARRKRGEAQRNFFCIYCANNKNLRVTPRNLCAPLRFVFIHNRPNHRCDIIHRKMRGITNNEP
jgi:hypothetical protein